LRRPVSRGRLVLLHPKGAGGLPFATISFPASSSRHAR
jgi:hypothetical protein